MYRSIIKLKVHYFLAQLLKESVYPNFVMAETFLLDLMKLSCESKQIDGSLWYIFYDKQRKFWPMYMKYNGTKFNDNIIPVFKNCNQRGLVDAVIKGGNVLLLSALKTIELPLINMDQYLHSAPCIIAKSVHLFPRLFYRTRQNVQTTGDATPYSHPLILDLINTYMLYGDIATNTKQIAAAKGFLSLKISGYFRECKSKRLISPHMLAYFFNHAQPLIGTLELNDFYRSHFVSLLFKITMDFHTFVFPKNSAAWRCYRCMNAIKPMTLKEFVCRRKLENEICSLLTELYLTDWRLFYHIYSFKEIYKFVDHGQHTPFDFISFFQGVRTKCQARRINESYLQIDAYNKAKQYVDINCSNSVKFVHSRSCLKNISFLNKQRKYINYQIQSILIMYFPLTYIIYHRFILELPDLAQKMQ